jgi:hypothetical protein
LGITRLLSGVGRMLQSRGRLHFYWVHTLWIVNVFLYIVLNWWILFRWQQQTQWTFFLFMFLLISPTITFLLSVLLFPNPIRENTDLDQHFYDNSRWFFILAALLPLVDLADTLLKGIPHFFEQGPFYIVTISLLTVLMVIALLTKKRWYHCFFAIFFLVYILVFISINLLVLA